MKKIIALFCTLTLVLAMFAGCVDTGEEKPADTAPTDTSTEGSTPDASGTEKTGDERLVVYGIYKAGDQPWFIDEGNAARKAVEAAGGEFIYVDAKMDAEEYLRAVDNAIANKASGVVTCPVDQQMSQAVVDKLDAAGIPVVACDDALETADGTKLSPWVGLDAYVIGEGMGEWMAGYVKDNDLATKEDVAMLIMTMDTVSSTVPRSEGQVDKFLELTPAFNAATIYKADYTGETDKGFNAAQAMITAHPEVKTWLVMAPNDEGAVGAIRALEQAGVDETAAVLGLGAYFAKDEFQKGTTSFKAAAYSAPDEVGRVSVEVLMEMINGGTYEMQTAVPAVMVTPENYVEVMGDAAQ